MAGLGSQSVARQLGALFEGGSAVGLGDRALLDRFATNRDEAAFAALVARHGPMVMGVCRRTLPDAHLAEDAFQAVFLVLARRAATIRDPDRLAGWLRGVAVRTSRKARGRLARLRGAEEQAAGKRPEARDDDPADRALERERAEALHRELDRLPAPFRAAVRLCSFEGLSPDEAAAQLRWPGGTLRSRLVRARARLRDGLVRRGIHTVGVAIADRPIPPVLVHTTARAALRFASDPFQKAPAAAIAREILRVLMVQKLRSACLTVLMLGGVAVGLGPMALDTFADPPKLVEVPHSDDSTSPLPGRMLVTGRVLDPDGKPVAHARVMAYAATYRAGLIVDFGKILPAPIGRAIADASGRFRIEADRLTSARHHGFGVLATAPGLGAEWAAMDLDDDRPEVEIRLRPERLIRGRITDPAGKPCAGVRVEVLKLGHIPESATGPSGDLLMFGWSHGRERPGWPGPEITDDEGRFTLPGIGRGFEVWLGLIDPRFARQESRIQTGNAPQPMECTFVLTPPRILDIQVADARTGEPIPHAPVFIESRPRLGLISLIDLQTDDRGRLRANPVPGDIYNVQATGPPDRPHLQNSTGWFAWRLGTTERRVDLALDPGFLIRGRIVEEGSDRPVVGARIALIRTRNAANRDASDAGADSSPDGSFLMATQPRPGTLVVLGPSDDYLYQEIDSYRLRWGQPGRERSYTHAVVPFEPEPGAGVPPITIRLRRGETVRGLAVGPDDQPIASAILIGRTLRSSSVDPWRSWNVHGHTGRVRNGRFELHGLDPDAEVPIHFVDPTNRLGATMKLSGKMAANGPITVRLQPCATARARVIHGDGRPVSKYPVRRLISIVVTPGRSPAHDGPPGTLDAEQVRYTRFLPALYGAAVSDTEGRIEFPALIPGASYCLTAMPLGRAKGLAFHRDLVPRAGETIDLGEIRMD